MPLFGIELPKKDTIWKRIKFLGKPRIFNQIIRCIFIFNYKQIKLITMANRPIHIQGINADGSLQLSDNGITTANPGDTIQWLIDNNSCVASISSIHDTSAVDVFNPDPTRMQGNSQNWQGTINPNLSPLPQTENYCIYYTKPGSSQIYTHDPRIQVESV